MPPGSKSYLVLFDFFVLIVKNHIYSEKFYRPGILPRRLPHQPGTGIHVHSYRRSTVYNGLCTIVIIAFTVNVSKGAFVWVGTFFLTLLGGRVFVYIRIVQSCVMNWKWNKSNCVLKFSSPVSQYYIAVLWHSNTVWNMAKKICLDLETWSAHNCWSKGLPPREHSRRRRPSRKITRMPQISIHSVPLEGSWPMLWYLYSWIISFTNHRHSSIEYFHLPSAALGNSFHRHQEWIRCHSRL